MNVQLCFPPLSRRGPHAEGAPLTPRPHASDKTYAPAVFKSKLPMAIPGALMQVYLLKAIPRPVDKASTMANGPQCWLDPVYPI